MDRVTPQQAYAVAFGKLVSELRREAGLDQRELAARVGVSQATLSRIERGEAPPDLYTARGLARALGKDLAWLDEKAEEALERATDMVRASGMASDDDEREAEGLRPAAGGAAVLLSAFFPTLPRVALGGLIGFTVASMLHAAAGDDD